MKHLLLRKTFSMFYNVFKTIEIKVGFFPENCQRFGLNIENDVTIWPASREKGPSDIPHSVYQE